MGGARACPLSLGLLCPAAAPSPPHARAGTAPALTLSPRPGLTPWAHALGSWRRVPLPLTQDFRRTLGRCVDSSSPHQP